MKKNISINISGIIFHIEEDGYEALRKYLDSINRYFGSFEDSSEILADIESRIAEIFLSKLNEGKQVITADDVQSLITTMGSVNDFRAAEAQEVVDGETSQQEQSQRRADSGSTSSGSTAATKRLYRDNRRKILGGVCAGFGHYFNVDPVWPRLLFALLVLGTTGLLILVYIILWIVLPVSEELEDESNIKKMYRDPDNKVLAGVSSGVAAFFGVDVTLIRVLFVVFTIFFGTGLVVYIILWIALPEAKTITEKMKMQGEPVTLSNIESSIKKGLNEKDPEQESTLAKIILFPFRMIAAVLTGTVSVLGPAVLVIVDIIRMIFGIALSTVAMIALIALMLAAFIWFGVISASAFPEGSVINHVHFPFEPIRQAFPTWTILFAFIAAAIPLLFIFMLGSSVIRKKIVFPAAFGWTLFALFFVSLAYLGFTIPQIIYSFREDGEFKVEQIFAANGKKQVLTMREVGLEDYDFTDLSLRGYAGTDIKLVERFTAQGPSKMNAKENAKQVEYHVVQTDSLITFDSNILFKPDSKFRFQRLDMDLYIPYEQPFVIDPDFWPLVENHWNNEFNGQHERQTYTINKNGKLECLTCPAPAKDMSGLSANDQFGFKDFNEIDMSGAFDVVIQQGDEYAVQLEGDDSQKKRYAIKSSGETLEVEYHTKAKDFWKNNVGDDEMVKLTITMPNLRKLKVKGAGKIKIRGFHEEETKISLTGAMVGDARISVNQLSVDMTGPVVFELDGEGDFLEASIAGPAQLRATNYPVNHGIIEAHGLGQARVNVRGTLEIEKDFTSNVHYTGDPEVIEKN